MHRRDKAALRLTIGLGLAVFVAYGLAVQLPYLVLIMALLGLRGLVFKSHGSADAYAFEQALTRAYDAARNRLLDRVQDRIVDTLPAGQDRLESLSSGDAASPQAA